MGKPRQRRGSIRATGRKPEPQHSSNCSDRRVRSAKRKMTDFRLWPSLPEGPLLRVFEMVYEGPRGRLELRSASLVCRAWRESAQEILLGDTAASRPHRATLASTSQLPQPKPTITTCRAVVLEESKSVSSGNEACSKRRALPLQAFPRPTHAAAAGPLPPPAPKLSSQWKHSPLCANPGPKQQQRPQEAKKLSCGEAAEDEAGPGPSSRMGMLTRAAAAVAAQGAQPGPSSAAEPMAPPGPSHMHEAMAAAAAASREPTGASGGHMATGRRTQPQRRKRASNTQEATEATPTTTAAASADEAGPSIPRAASQGPLNRKRRQVSLKQIIESDPGPADGVGEGAGPSQAAGPKARRGKHKSGSASQDGRPHGPAPGAPMLGARRAGKRAGPSKP